MIRKWERQVRYVGRLTILFNTKETVYVTDGRNIVVVHRWFDRGQGRYTKHWKPFVTIMKNTDIETTYDALRYARRYELSYQGATKMPSVEGATIIKKEK